MRKLANGTAYTSNSCSPYSRAIEVEGFDTKYNLIIN